MFQFYLDGTLLENDPIGWEDFKEELIRNNSVKGLLKIFPLELTFTGDGYGILRDLKQQFGYCELVTLKILQKCNDTADYVECFNGIILLSDVVFNLNQCLARTTVQDNSYTAKIFNNKNIKANLSSPKSKNGTDITACPKKTIQFFNPVDGVYLNSCTCFDVYDAFEFLIAFMTDGDVGFESDYLNTLDDDRNLSLTAGIELRLANGNNFPSVSFQDLFDNINKKIPIAFAVEKDVNGDPYIRIENEDYFFSTISTFQFDNIKDLEESVYTPSLYSSIRVGSTNAVKYNQCKHSLAGSSFIGFKEAEFYFQTKCNIDSSLDLLSSFIIDSNTIEEVYRSGLVGELDCNGDAYGVTDSYDDDVVLVQYTKTTLKATQTNIQDGSITPPPYHYNGILNNKSVIERRSLQAALAQYFQIANQDNTFLAAATSDTTEEIVNADLEKDIGLLNYSGTLDATQDAGGWATEISDPSTLYDPVLSKYTAATDGYHKFVVNAQVRIIEPSILNTEGNRDILDIKYTAKYKLNGVEYFYNYSNNGDPDFEINEKSHIVFFNNGAIPAQTFQILGGTIITGYDKTLATIQMSINIYLSAGDEMVFILKMKPVAYYGNGTPASMVLTNYARRVNYTLTRVSTSDAFPSVTIADLGDKASVVVTPDNGGVVADGNSDSYKCSLLKFTYPLSNQDIDLIETDQIKSFNANIDGRTNSVGWINKISRNKATGMADVELISDTANI